MHKELLTLFNRVTFPTSNEGARVDPRHVEIFNTEVASLGYAFNGVCMERMRGMARGDFVDMRRRVIADLVEITGADKRHQTLFARFPQYTPDQGQYLLDRIIGYVQNEIGYKPSDFQVLSCGHVVDLRLFDLREYGACPICQFQVDQIPWMKNRGNAPFESVTPLKTIVYCDDAMLADTGSALLARNSSLSAAEKAFLRQVAERVPLRVPETIFKETLPFVYAIMGREAVRSHISGATDVLRILVYVSDPEKGDLSLAEPTKLVISNARIKDAMSLMEDLPQIEEDLLRHRGRWKIFARKAHVSKAAFRKRFPRATAAFAKLLGDERSIVTFNRTAEPLIRSRLVEDLATHLMERPGEFLRKLDFMLRNAPSDAHVVPVMEALALSAPKAQTKMLFEVKKYLEHRDQAVGQRVFLPKGAINKAKIVEDKRPGIPDAFLLRAIGIIDMELQSRLSRQEPLGRVYIDPTLAKILIPYNRRGDSGTSVPVAKGSRMPISPEAEVLRMFVHWTGMIDVDLSVVLLSESFEMLTQISWTNLRGSGFVHSGDIRSAPKGASEFIDVEIATVMKAHRARAPRYVAVSVLSFRGEGFDGFPCFAGYMERDGLKSGEVYEPQAVSLKFDLNGPTKSYVPLMFDLVTREVIYVDLATSGGAFQAVARQENKMAAVARMAVDLPNTKPTVHDVLTAHARARGTIVSSPDEADRVWRREGLDMEAVMAMMA